MQKIQDNKGDDQVKICITTLQKICVSVFVFEIKAKGPLPNPQNADMKYHIAILMLIADILSLVVS